MSSRPSLLMLLLTLLASPALAQVAVSDAWVRGTVGGQKASGAFMVLQSPVDSALVSVASSVAGVVEVHEMAMEGGMMKMRAVPRLALPAGKPVMLKPGGYHVMLMDLKGPLKEGASVDLTLTFADKEGRMTTQQVKAPVKALTTSTGAKPH